MSIHCVDFTSHFYLFFFFLFFNRKIPHSNFPQVSNVRSFDTFLGILFFCRFRILLPPPPLQGIEKKGPPRIAGQDLIRYALHTHTRTIVLQSINRCDNGENRIEIKSKILLLDTSPSHRWMMDWWWWLSTHAVLLLIVNNKKGRKKKRKMFKYMYTSYRFDRHSVSWALSEEGSFLAAITLVNPIWPPSTFSCVRCHISFYTLGTVSVCV
jgi:hypothetical protein